MGKYYLIFLNEKLNNSSKNTLDILKARRPDAELYLSDQVNGHSLIRERQVLNTSKILAARN